MREEIGMGHGKLEVEGKNEFHSNVFLMIDSKSDRFDLIR
jgi:hypothetical protein